ncbi:MAG: hypothetical protein IJW00_07325 [Clostridia bacterium]|nr:hypothetical protein [Clostridia bacterium]
MKLISADGTDPLLRSTDTRTHGFTINLLSECTYTVGQTRVYCWLCKYDAQSKEEGKLGTGRSLPSCRLIMYAGQTCLMFIETATLEEGELIFDLMRRYELSPYHVEDVLEDRELQAYIQRL